MDCIVLYRGASSNIVLGGMIGGGGGYDVGNIDIILPRVLEIRNSFE